MADLVGVLGSVTPPGRLYRALEAALGAAPADVATRLIDLGRHRIAFADGRPPDQLGDDTVTVVEAIASAGGVLFASPVYRASFTGALKNLLDHVPVEALAGKPCGIIAMGATQHHYLGVDRHLRDVLAWFGALVAPTSVYLASADFADGELRPEARAELAELVQAVARLQEFAGGGGALGPPPLAARRG
jgi:FMN reductase